MTLIQNFGMFLLGIRDSLSLSWIKKILFYSDPQTKRIHPSSSKMLKSLQLSVIQVIVFLIAIPSVFEYLGYAFISMILNTMFLILTLGYLFFYNDDLITSTRNVILWKIKTNKTQTPIYQLDKKYKIQIFTSLSGQLKGFIFLIFYYMPIFIIETQILINIPYVGLLCLIVSQSFFNGAFYFLKIWPYDKYNIGYIQKNIWYMSGYGLFVSVLCNAVLSGSLARGAYFLISMVMFINCVIYSPPQIQFKNWRQIYEVLSVSSKRDSLPNGYNVHRQRTLKDAEYRKQITGNIRIVYPSLKVTQIINKKLSHLVNEKLKGESASTMERAQKDENTDENIAKNQDTDNHQTVSSSSLSIALQKISNQRKLSQVSQVEQLEQNKE